jgi:cytochrome P450
MPRNCPVLDFDHHAIDGGTRFARWDELRAMGPVFWSENYGGFWVVSRFDEVAAVLRDDVSFSSAKTAEGTGGQSIPPFMWQRNVPGEYDGAEHLRLRQVMLPALAPKLIEQRRPVISAIVTDIFDRVAGRAEIDAVREIAVAVPARSMFAFMGMAADADWMGLAAHEIMNTRQGTARAGELAAVLEKINQRMLEEVEDRRRRPGDDVI